MSTGQRRKIRYRFAGERPDDSRLLSVPEGGDALAALSLAVDFHRFTPHIYSHVDEAWVALTPSNACDAAFCPPTERGHLDVRLWPRASSLPSTDLSDGAELQCDSAAAGLSASFFGIGIVRSKAAPNHGSVWRSALQLGASFTFTVGASFSRKVEGAADVYKGLRTIPCIAYADEDAFAATGVVGAEYVAVEYGGETLSGFVHPRRAVYVLGAEREGLSKEMVARCQRHVSIDVADGRPSSMNVAAAAAVIMWDRSLKLKQAKALSLEQKSSAALTCLDSQLAGASLKK